MAVDVKICGITRPSDAAAAVGAGASYLGVVFGPGPRQVDVSRAADIVAAAGPVPVFGVFVDVGIVDVAAAVEEAGLAGVQLHGPYAAEVGQQLRALGLVVWRVGRLAGEADVRKLGLLTTGADAVVVEPRVAGVPGGAGVALPLYVARLARAVLTGFPMVLAGGLTPETVAEAIASAGPDVVDVSSGVETRSGIKDPARIRRFMEAVRGNHPPA